MKPFSTTIMNILDYSDFLTWIAIIALVILTTRTAMWINRMLIYRAHRKALDQLRRTAMLSESRLEMQPDTSGVPMSAQRSEDVERF